MNEALKLAHNALTFAKPMIGALCADSPTADVRDKRNKVYAKVEAALTALVAEMATTTVQISDEDMKRLQEWARDYFVVKGETPLSLEKTAHRVIDGLWRELHPWKPEPLREDQGR